MHVLGLVGLALKCQILEVSNPIKYCLFAAAICG